MTFKTLFRKNFQMIRYKIILLGLLFGSILFVIFQTPGTHKLAWGRDDTVETSTPFTPSCQSMFHELMSSHRQCLVKQTSSPGADLTQIFETAVMECRDEALWKLFDVHTVGSNDDDKWIILPGDYANKNCVQISLGIGNNIQSEKKLLELLPQCKLYGADPVLKSGKIFNEVGKYFQYAVGAETGYENASVFQRGGYYYEQVEFVDLLNFVQNMVKTDRVDYLWMDSEGAEYKMIPKFFINPNITICQWSIEIHGPLENYWVNLTEFNSMIRSIFEQSPFLPLFATPKNYHHIVFFVNVQDQYCLDRYLLPRFCLLYDVSKH